MPYQGPQTVKTYNRPTDRWPDDMGDDPGLGACQSQGFVGQYLGTTWNVQHKLKTQNLIVTVWVDPASAGLSPTMSSIMQLTDSHLQVVWNGVTPIRGRIVIYAACADNAASDIVYAQGTPEAVWVIPHSMGLLNAQLITSFWVSGVRVDPISITYDAYNITATFYAPCTGVACLVRVNPLRIKGRAGAVHVQETADTVWSFSHPLNTSDVLAQVWLEDSTVSLQGVALSETTVDLILSAPTTGSIVLMDPFPLAECPILIRQIVDWPATFPPTPHSHEKDEILLALDSENLGGKAASEYLQRSSDLGQTTCPLELTQAGTRKVPLQFLPTASTMWIEDADGAIVATQLVVDSLNTGLYVQKDPANSRAILSLQFQPQVLDVQGRVLLETGMSPAEGTAAQIRTAAGQNWTLEIGTGILARKLSSHVLRLELDPLYLPQVYTLSGGVSVLNSGGSWFITDPIYIQPTFNYMTQIYEVIDSGLPAERKRGISIGDLPGQVLIDIQPTRLIVINNTGRNLQQPMLILKRV